MNEQQEPARSGLAAEIIARNAIEGATAYTDEQWADDLEKRGHDLLPQQIRRAIQAEARVAELKRREALWDQFALAFDWWHQWCEVCDTEGCATPENLWDLVPGIVKARTALDWKPVVWIEPNESAEFPY